MMMDDDGAARARRDRLRWAEGLLREAETKAGMIRESRSSEFHPPAPLEAGVAGRLGVSLTKGALIGVAGSTSLLLTLVGEAAREGTWVAIVGMPDLGVVAAAEYGIALERVVLVPAPGAQVAGVVAALIDGFDVVVLGAGVNLPPGQRRSLLGRARRWRTTMFTPLWPEVPVRLRARPVSWAGLGSGRGYVRERQIVVRNEGRGQEQILYLGPQSVRVAAGREGVRHVG